MGWRRGEVWLETDLLWFREGPARAAFAQAAPAYVPAFATPPGLVASRQRRAEQRRQRAARKTRAAVLVMGPAAMFPFAGLRNSTGADASGVLKEDPPSLTLRLASPGVIEAPIPRRQSRASVQATPEHRRLARQAAAANVDWNHATSNGLPYAGNLVDGTQLPVEGPDWITWNPVTDSVPNAPHRLYGNEHTIRTVISVLAAYRAANPDSPRAVVGDISFEDGGPMNEHVSHQNGLDVDVYYPRSDHSLRAPLAPDEIDSALAQDLLDRFVAAGAQMVFVGYSTGLHGPSGVVIPYPNHENHMHVRFPPPTAQ